MDSEKLCFQKYEKAVDDQAAQVPHWSQATPKKTPAPQLQIQHALHRQARPLSNQALPASIYAQALHCLKTKVNSLRNQQGAKYKVMHVNQVLLRCCPWRALHTLAGASDSSKKPNNSSNRVSPAAEKAANPTCSAELSAAGKLECSLSFTCNYKSQCTIPAGLGDVIIFERRMAADAQILAD